MKICGSAKHVVDFGQQNKMENRNRLLDIIRTQSKLINEQEQELLQLRRKLLEHEDWAWRTGLAAFAMALLFVVLAFYAGAKSEAMYIVMRGM